MSSKKAAAKAASKAEEAKQPATKVEAKPFVLKPKKPTSAWIYFNNETVAKLKETKGMDQKQAFGESSVIWKKLTEQDKLPYTQKAKEDEERYKKQVKELETQGFFMTQDGKKSTELYVDPKKKYGEDCVVPKKPMSAYLFYTTSNVSKIKEKEGCTHPEAMKKCGEDWNKFTDADKQVYSEQQKKDLLRYQEQLNMLDKEGFFLMDDGSKSSDHKAQPKKGKKKEPLLGKKQKAEKVAKKEEIDCEPKTKILKAEQ